MARNTPLKFMGMIRERHKARKAQRRAKLKGLLGGGGGTADSLPGGAKPMVGGLGGIIVGGHQGSGGMWGAAASLFGAKPKAEEAGVPPHSHDVEDTDVESPMAKKLKFGKGKTNKRYK